MLSAGAAGHPRLTSVVVPCPYALPAGRFEQLAHGVALVESMFQQQPAAHCQDARNFRSEPANIVEPVRAALQRADWLMSERCERVVTGRDVGWVRNDKIELFARKRLGPVAYLKLHVAQFEASAIVSRDIQRRWTDVACRQGAAGSLFGNRQRDRARSCAEVGDTRIAMAIDHIQRDLDKTLGIRARDQRVGRYLERQRPEFPLTDNVGDGFTGGPARKQGVERLPGIVRDGLIAV